MCYSCNLSYYHSQLNPVGERIQTPFEELCNCVSHVIGLCYVLFELHYYKILSQKRQMNCNISLFKFGISNNIYMRYVFQRLDHVMIYIMIAGCYSGYILSRVLDKGYKKQEY
ncbi:Hemolysin III [Entamoeba marina]